MTATMLAVVPVRGGVLPAGGAEVTAEAGGRVLLVGSGTKDAAAELAGVATSVEVVELPEVRFGTWARTLAPLLATTSPEAVVLPASPDGRDLAPRLAAALARPLFAGAVEVAVDRVTMSRHGGLSLVEHLPRGPFVATLQSGVRGAERTHGEEAVPTVAEVAVEEDPSDAAVTTRELLPPDVGTMDLAEAPRIVGGGAGLLGERGAENFELLGRVGAELGSTLGATRVVTDVGLLGHDRQIGTTGVVVDPRLYLAFGISGAVQHTAGLGHPEHVISVNTDPHCPMMAMADLAVVSDAPAVVEALARRLDVAPVGEEAAPEAAGSGMGEHQ